jgi:hypothetical protein
MQEEKMDIADLLFKAEQRGFRHNFAGEDLHPGDFDPHGARIVYSQAVDQGTDPGDDATLYLIETADGQKGYLIVGDAFRTDPQKAALIDQLARRREH